MNLKQGEQNKKEVMKGIFKFAAGTAALLTGAFVLSRSAIYKSAHFRRPDLTQEQLDSMDFHNANHSLLDVVRAFTDGVSTLFRPSDYDRKRMDELKAE